LQVNVHDPPAHVGWAWATVVVHAVAHAPQLLALLIVFTHVAPQSVGVPAGHPDVQA
jgi:hypothetical protein